MPTLLHVVASPRGEQSQSTQVADAFIATLEEVKPGLDVETLDLWEAKLPVVDVELLDAKSAAMRGLPHTDEQAARWKGVVERTEPLRRADYLLFSVPMWNWSIPYVLKYYIDVVTQPGQLFSWSPETSYVGLLQAEAAVIYSSSFTYEADGPHAGYDFQKPYFEHWLSIVGVKLAGTVTVSPTAGPPASVAAAREIAIDEAVRLARRF